MSTNDTRGMTGVSSLTSAPTLPLTPIPDTAPTTGSTTAPTPTPTPTPTSTPATARERLLARRAQAEAQEKRHLEQLYNIQQGRQWHIERAIDAGVKAGKLEKKVERNKKMIPAYKQEVKELQESIKTNSIKLKRKGEQYDDIIKKLPQVKAQVEKLTNEMKEKEALLVTCGSLAKEAGIESSKISSKIKDFFIIGARFVGLSKTLTSAEKSKQATANQRQAEEELKTEKDSLEQCQTDLSALNISSLSLNDDVFNEKKKLTKDQLSLLSKEVELNKLIKRDKKDQLELPGAKIREKLTLESAIDVQSDGAKGRVEKEIQESIQSKIADSKKASDAKSNKPDSDNSAKKLSSKDTVPGLSSAENRDTSQSFRNG
jgi:hypothetical protein